MKRVRQRIIINKDSTKAMWRRFTRLKRERPWVDCLTPFSDFIQNMGNRERERERLRERKRGRERESVCVCERERERERERK